MTQRRQTTWNARTYRPALDGLRAVAVAAVIIYHVQRAYLPGGHVGVDLFFALSGFLITGLIMAEIERRGTISVGKFMARRATRLFPALAVMLIVVSIWKFPGVRALWGTVLYVANWVAVVSGLGALGPLLHMWSLAVEEQFYLVWPLAILLVLKWQRRRQAGAVARQPRKPGTSDTIATVRIVMTTAAAAGVIGAIALRALFGVNSLFAQFGTFTRVDGILLGAILAMWMEEILTRVSRAFLIACALVGWVGFLWLLSPLADDVKPYVVPFIMNLIVLSVASMAVPLINTVLSLRPVVWVGQISYGLYLWHMPAYALLPLGMSAGRRTVLVLAVTLAATVASYYLVERPISMTMRPRLKA